MRPPPRGPAAPVRSYIVEYQEGALYGILLIAARNFRRARYAAVQWLESSHLLVGPVEKAVQRVSFKSSGTQAQEAA